jgi:hypothetical protein
MRAKRPGSGPDADVCVGKHRQVVSLVTDMPAGGGRRCRGLGQARSRQAAELAGCPIALDLAAACPTCAADPRGIRVAGITGRHPPPHRRVLIGQPGPSGFFFIPDRARWAGLASSPSVQSPMACPSPGRESGDRRPCQHSQSQIWSQPTTVLAAETNQSGRPDQNLPRLASQSRTRPRRRLLLRRSRSSSRRKRPGSA